MDKVLETATGERIVLSESITLAREQARRERAAQRISTAQRVTAHDLGDRGLAVNHYQDVEPIMDICARERRVDRERTAFKKRGEFRRTMSIPFNILMKVSKEHNLNFFDKDDAKKVKAIVARDYPVFKTVNDKRI